jgi:Holliday junction resolvasome RuvABC DNA-binding subunit
LGYKRAEAERAVKQARSEHDGAPLEAVIRAALRGVAG